MDIDQIANSQVSHDNNKRLLIDYSMLDNKLREVRTIYHLYSYIYNKYL